MATQLMLYRDNPETGKYERTKLIVPVCPMFDIHDRNRTPEALALEAAGWKYSGHRDGVTEEGQAS